MKNIPKLITQSSDLKFAIDSISDRPFIAIDTEFMREKTYYSQLCLVQLCSEDTAFCIDTLAPDIDLSPLFALMVNPNIIKIFHAGRQDMEIFVNMTGDVPMPVYDTQIAAMVCGLGDQVAYDKLAQHYIGVTLDKSSRFTNWSQRPLTERQISYALDDVIYLAAIYPKICNELEKSGRSEWVASELDYFADKNLYIADAKNVWKKIKAAGNRPEQLNRLACLAEWREIESQKRNVPRGWVLRDDTLIDLAGSNPKSVPDLGKIRGFPNAQNERFTTIILSVLNKANQVPKQDWPAIRSKKYERPPVALTDLLRVFQKHIAESHNVAPRLIATSDELEQLALFDDASIPAMSGWRFDVFGKQALALKSGKLALCVSNGQIRVITIDHA